jgi:hypothetical protein
MSNSLAGRITSLIFLEYLAISVLIRLLGIVAPSLIFLMSATIVAVGVLKIFNGICGGLELCGVELGVPAGVVDPIADGGFDAEPDSSVEIFRGNPSGPNPGIGKRAGCTVAIPGSPIDCWPGDGVAIPGSPIDCWPGDGVAIPGSPIGDREPPGP